MAIRWNEVYEPLEHLKPQTILCKCKVYKVQRNYRVYVPRIAVESLGLTPDNKSIYIYVTDKKIYCNTTPLTEEQIKKYKVVNTLKRNSTLLKSGSCFFNLEKTIRRLYPKVTEISIRSVKDDKDIFELQFWAGNR